MVYGLTGNQGKDRIWPVLAGLTEWLSERNLDYRFPSHLAPGLRERSDLPSDLIAKHGREDFVESVDLIVSFGGDGTMLQTAFEVGARQTPILGVNLGQVGFLADVEVEQIYQAIGHLQKGNYSVESRMVLEGAIGDGNRHETQWALNDFVIDKSGSASMVTIEVHADGRYLNTYRADGLIVATPTGSTAYSLSAGGPIIEPGSGVITVTPIAPHTLTVRPIVLSENTVVQATVTTRDRPYVFASDGRSRVVEDLDQSITIRRAAHDINLVKLPDSDYFQTLRSKLAWGQRNSEL